MQLIILRCYDDYELFFLMTTYERENLDEDSREDLPED
jgi:hypothetical protein